MTEESPVVAKTKELLSTAAATKNDQFPLTTDISIPFESDRHADIIARSLLVDYRHEGKRMSAGITKEISASRNELLIRFTTASVKSLRVNVNSILDLVAVLIDTVANFDISSSIPAETPISEEKKEVEKPEKNGNSPSPSPPTSSS